MNQSRTRRGILIVRTMMLMVLTLAAAGLSSVAVAQQGTPPLDEEFDLPEGVTFEFIASGEATELPP